MRRFVRINLTIFILVIIHNILIGQSNAQITKIISSAFSQTKVKFHHEKSLKLNQLDYQIPLIENVELRTETNDFDLRKQDVVIRVSSNNSTKRRAYKLYHESVQHMTEMEYNSSTLNALTERYELIVDYVFTQEKINIQEQLLYIAQDKVKLLKRMILLSEFDIVQLIKAEDEVYRLQRSLQNYKNEISENKHFLKDILEINELNISKNQILSVPDIELIIDHYSNNAKIHPEVEIMSARHYNAMMEHEWESSKSKFSLGFIQAKYGYNENESFGNNFSVGVGFDFPFKGSSRLDLNEKKINILDTQSRYITVKEDFLQTKNKSFTRLKRLLETHKLLSSQINEGNAEYALKEYSKQSIASPISIIELKTLKISNEMLLLEIEEEIINSYLQYLFSTGLLAEKPYRNFLDNRLSVF